MSTFPHNDLCRGAVHTAGGCQQSRLLADKCRGKTFHTADLAGGYVSGRMAHFSCDEASFRKRNTNGSKVKVLGFDTT